MGDGIMAVFADPATAVRASMPPSEAVKSVEVDGLYAADAGRVSTPAGRSASASDWLGVDVNIAARVMERATKGGVMISSPTLDLIPQSELDAHGRDRQASASTDVRQQTTGIPPDLAIYRLKTDKELSTSDNDQMRSNVQA